MLVLEKEITIQKLVQEVLKRWWLVAVCIILCGAIFFTYTNYFVDELYTSHASIYVDNKATEVIEVEGVENNTANLYDLTTAEMLVDTYIEILTSQGFFETIQKYNPDLPFTAAAMRSMVSYSRVEETGVIHIYVTAPTPEFANEICDSILKYANVQIMNIMEVGSVKTIDRATMPMGPSYPNVPKMTLFGMIIGMLISFGIIFMINYFDVHIKTVEDIESKYDLIVLGTIPNMFTNGSSAGGVDYE